MSAIFERMIQVNRSLVLKSVYAKVIVHRAKIFKYKGYIRDNTSGECTTKVCRLAVSARANNKP